MNPENTTRWYDALLPIVQRGGPVLTLFVLLVLAVSVWWLVGWMHDCVDRNRELTEKLLATQQTFYQELRMVLANCPKE